MPAHAVPIDVKEQGIIWLLPPYCWSHRQIARKLDISPSVVSKWRCELVERGLLPENEKVSSADSDEWTPERRFSVVLETATLSEMELADYCRRMGLFVEQVKEWQVISIQAHEIKLTENRRADKELREARSKLRELEKELQRKNKALAEAAALLILREKFQCPLGQQRGRLTPLPERQKIISLVNDAVTQGASKTRACQCIGISVRTLQRWVESPDGQILADRRPEAIHRLPANKLSETERQQIMDICNSPEFAGLSPNVIVPALADKGIYITSEATFYRILKVNKRLTRRRRESQYKRPDALKAVSPNQVWSWDIGYLPSWIKGQHFYLYMILDIFSRKIVAAEVFLNESGEHAANLLQRAVWSEKCSTQNIILHSDNGGPMRSYTMLAKMYSLGILSSYSRPRVSNDNPYSESLFRTLKYCPWWPKNGFSNIDEARGWVTRFVNGYNFEHKHSGIRYVTPDERHRGIDTQILLNRKAVYLAACQHHPERWSKEIRNWEHIQEVYLNPEKEAA
ncbi:IS3 family transposase [Photorhabdus khanii]|uniref:IS3 family transposase n=1 Tax=Photorhabdus khanii TaxID=1004150 RepID=UPI0039C2AA87